MSTKATKTASTDTAAPGLVHRYPDRTGKWNTTYGYDSTNLLALATLADRAHRAILALQGEKP